MSRSYLFTYFYFTNNYYCLSGALQTQAGSQTGAMKLLNELDSLSGLLGSDLSNSDVTQSVKTTTTQSKTVNLSKVSSPFHGQPFGLVLKGSNLDTDNGIYTDTAGKSFSLAQAFERDIINPDSAVFISPRDNQSMTLHNAIQKELVGKNGHYYEPSGRRLNLSECLAKSIVVSREVVPITVEGEKKEEHYKFHVDKVSLTVGYAMYVHMYVCIYVCIWNNSYSNTVIQ